MSCRRAHVFFWSSSLREGAQCARLHFGPAKKKKQGELGQRYHSAMTVLGLDVDESPACFGTNDTDASLRSTDGGFALVKLAAVAQACEFFFFFFNYN